jgi:CTP:molybdopterin cytidylyltransferase MocA
MARPIGVLLAAGRGRRMGTLKQLLRFGEGDGAKPLVGAAFDALAPFCDGMVVVLGADAERVREALAPRAFITAIADSEAEMMESVRAGLSAAAALLPGRDILLHPADHPCINPDVVAELQLFAEKNPRSWAIMPEHRGKGGHPVLIRAAAVPHILAWRGSGGLRAFWEMHTTGVARIPVNDATSLLDLDTPEDLRDAMAAVSAGRRSASS